MDSYQLNILDTLSILKKDGVVNIMYMNSDNKVKAIRYDDKEILLKDLAKYDGKYNIYLTLNQIRTELDIGDLNRPPKGRKSISDKEIEKYLFILIDLDPERKSKTSSTNDEHNAAKEMLEDIKKYLISMGLDGFITASSGNGYHILLRVDIDNNVDNIKTVKEFLKS